MDYNVLACLRIICVIMGLQFYVGLCVLAYFFIASPIVDYFMKKRAKKKNGK